MDNVGKNEKPSAANAGEEFEELIQNAANGKSAPEADVNDADPVEDGDDNAEQLIIEPEESESQISEALAVLKAQAQRNLEGWQRSEADFENFKRRKERELTESRERVTLDTLAKILPIVDDFERSMDNIPEDLADNPWVTGTALISKKFQKLLEENGIEILDPVGEKFDPNRHEAVGMDADSDMESGYVTTTLQKGYIAGERVLRPALVRVAS